MPTSEINKNLESTDLVIQCDKKKRASYSYYCSVGSLSLYIAVVKRTYLSSLTSNRKIAIFKLALPTEPR